MTNAVDMRGRAGPFVKSADRVLDLLEHLAAAGAPPNFGQISHELGIPKSSLSQLLGNLAARNYVKLDARSNTYRLGDKLAELSRTAMSTTPFQEILRKTLERLRDEINETAAFYIRRGDEAQVLESIGSRQSLVFMITVGDRAPLYAHSAGKIMLAHMSEAEFQAYLERTTLEKLTPNTVDSKKVLRAEVERARQEGFAYAFEELAAGIKGLATPVTAAGRLCGALNVAVPASRYTLQLEGMMKSRLPRMAAELAEAALGCRFDPRAPAQPRKERLMT